MNNIIPPMKNFILPGGHPCVSHLHVARCICRRAERCCVRLQIENEAVEAIVIKYLNRLSDYLFVLARFIAFQLKVPETIWKPRG
jgi:cob(I)alamin adenosyltransferase